MFEINVQGFNEEIAKFDAMPARLRELLVTKINRWLVEIQRKIVSGLAAGAPLKMRSGESGLAGTVEITPAAEAGTVVQGAVESTATAQEASSGAKGAIHPYPYGMVHEFGGQRRYDIFPVTKKALAFEHMGKHIVTRAVLGHPPLMPRPWFYPAAKSLYADIVTDLNRSISEMMK
ncbi:MAG TPA: hypothetical protein VJW77_02335 [Terriglobia bacterium]|nr:hypothetical protein [Terriglobia bacterium]